ncbi:MAG: class I SAM-dependent methyltransferase family protein [Candidatus Bathyarchaeia archaeon]
MNTMPETAYCIRVAKTNGEKALTLAKKLAILNKSLEIQKDNGYLYIPLIRKPEAKELETLQAEALNIQVTAKVFTEKQQRKTLLQVLEEKLPPHLLASVPRALDIIGDIAIVEIPPELEAHETLIGEAILAVHKNLHTVLAKASAVSGTYRLREFKIIAGEHRTATTHREYGCKFQVDIAKAYFSPRLSQEHHRVASLVGKNEVVVDLFAGVGPFAVLIAKNHVDAKVYAVDINPDAVELLKRNIRLNRVENRVIPIQGDAKQVVEERLAGIADRVIMNLPEKAIEYVDAACKTLKPEGGIIHFYSFIRRPSSLEDLKRCFSDAVTGAERKVDTFLFARAVRETAPYEQQIVLDVQVI